MTVVPRISERPGGDPPFDDDLRQRVTLYLLLSGRMPLRRLIVEVKDGVVQLSGTVPTYYVRQLGVACARRVAGIRGVIDQIEVVMPVDSCPSGCGGSNWSEPEQ